MNCEEAIRIVDGYLDGELDPVTSQSIERHLRECQRCRQTYEAQRVLTRTIETRLPYYKASSELRRRIQASLREGANDSAPTSLELEPQVLGNRKQTESPRSAVFGAPWNWLAAAAALTLTAIIAVKVSPLLKRSDSDQFLATQLIASHVRSLMANHLTDVASSDQHTVKPWLDERLDFAAPVVDLSSEGFPQVGGRLDYLDNRAVAALVYQRRKHYINLFIWLAKPQTAGASTTISRQGYHILHWADSDFNYWAVSDVNANDLQTFKQLLQKQVLPR